MIRQSEYLQRAEITAVTLHMADKGITFSNEDIGYFILDEVEDSYTKEFSAFKEGKKAKKMVIVISSDCVGEIEWILSHHQRCAIYAISVYFEDCYGHTHISEYSLYDAWQKSHYIRVTSKGQLQILIGTLVWEFANRYESLPDWWFNFQGEVSNKGAVLYTEDTPVALRQSHYQIFSDSMFEITQLIEDAQQCFGYKTKAKIILVLSIFDYYCQRNGTTINIEKYTYLDSDGAPRNLRIENVWKNCSKEYNRVPPMEMRTLAIKLRNKTLSQLMDIRGEIICGTELDGKDISDIFDSI